MAAVALSVIDLILKAEPGVVAAVHNIMAGTGGLDDLKVLKMDVVAWQAIYDRSAQEIAKASGGA